jgi:hypothetical protein
MGSVNDQEPGKLTHLELVFQGRNRIFVPNADHESHVMQTNVNWCPVCENMRSSRLGHTRCKIPHAKLCISAADPRGCTNKNVPYHTVGSGPVL